MEKISVAIPTYNSYKFIRDSIPKIYKTKAIDEVIIHDDFSDKNDFEDILRFVSKYEKNKAIKLKTYRNNSNIGGYKNKYLAVEKCTNNIVYQLDSDNILSNSFSEIFDNNFIKNIDKNYIYLPSFIYAFKKNYMLTSFKKSSLIKIADKDVVLNKEEVKKEIQDNKLSYKPMNWLLNLGNWLFNKDTYLEKLREGYESKDETSAADAIAGTYYWLKNGGSIMLKKDFYHHHRLRSDSYYVSTNEITPKLVEKYLNLISKL
tara:strand:+ start:748 stop:1530 length:783 start_codon:yes stop_codon:yes gene_type:complete